MRGNGEDKGRSMRRQLNEETAEKSRKVSNLF